MKKLPLSLLFLVLSLGLSAQELSPEPTITENLNQLEALLLNIETQSVWQESELTRLSQIIADSRSISMTQGELLRELRNQLDQMSAIAGRQSSLLEKSLLKSKIWKWSLIIAVPAAAGLGIWLGSLL
jgi:uncharacterized coiled-coil protein SlyX